MTLSINTVTAAAYYTFNVSARYYTKGGEAPGRWWGAGAAALNLSGNVDAEMFERLLRGQHPTHDEVLFQLQSKSGQPISTGNRQITAKSPAADHCPGFDLTFSAPKSVSAWWAVSDRATQKIIENAQLDAIQSVVGWAEEHLLLTRRGKGGHRREQAKLVVASFLHATSRNGDPQLHVHNVIANVCQASDGKWLTLDSRTLHNWIRTLGPMIRSTFARNLTERLGVELVHATDKEGQQQGWFEVAGVPAEPIEKWSSRRRDLVEALEGRGEVLGLATAKARESAALESRDSKPESVPREQLHARWREEAIALGFTPEKAAALCHRVSAPRPDEDAYRKAWQDSLKQLTTSEAYFTERRLIQEVAERLQTGQFTGVEIAQKVRHDLEHSRDIVPLRDKASDRQFTTRTMWDLEQRLLKDVETLKSQPGAQVSDRIAQRTLKSHRQLGPDQTEAARTILTETGAVRIMTGVAGAGKSTTLKVVKEGFEAAGYRVIGGALSGVAKEELASKTEMASRTVASYLHHLEKPTGQRIKDRVKHDAKQFLRALQGKTTYRKEDVRLDAKTVLVLDEAGMLDTRTLARIVAQVEKAGATLVLTGDPKQLQPIEAGGPLQKIVKDAPHAHLSANWRQKDADDRAAVQALREGRVADALQSYVERDRVTIGDNKRDTIQQLVAAWTKAGGARLPKDHVIFAQTRAEVRELNRQCQSARLKSARTPHIISVANGEERLYRGDRVLFHKADRRQGIENGYFGTVVSIDPIRRELKVRLDPKADTFFGRRDPRLLVTVSLKEFGEKGISLGFATTTHKGQGQTVKHSYLLSGGRMTDRELFYVQATRAAQTTRIFVDRSHAGDDLKDLIAAVEKSRAKNLAHDEARRDRPALRLEINRDSGGNTK